MLIVRGAILGESLEKAPIWSYHGYNEATLEACRADQSAYKTFRGIWTLC